MAIQLIPSFTGALERVDDAWLTAVREHYDRMAENETPLTYEQTDSLDKLLKKVFGMTPPPAKGAFSPAFSPAFA